MTDDILPPARNPVPGEPMTHDTPPPEPDVARKAGYDDVEAIAVILAEAFSSDPMMRWMVPDDSRRPAALKGMFRLLARQVWLPNGGSYVNDDGAAMWLPPGRWRLGFVQQMRMLVPTLMALRSDIVRMLRLDHSLEARHPEKPHWYLQAIGVKPDRQGQGLGTALMRPILDVCDRDGMPAYLESSSPANIRLYERNGFQVLEEFTPTAEAPPVWPMWRDPS